VGMYQQGDIVCTRRDIICKQCHAPNTREMGHLSHQSLASPYPRWRDYTIETCLCGYRHAYWNDADDGDAKNDLDLLKIIQLAGEEVVV